MLTCPVCARELEEAKKKEGGWDCRCGEFVPEAMVMDTEKLGCGRWSAFLPRWPGCVYK